MGDSSTETAHASTRPKEVAIYQEEKGKKKMMRKILFVSSFCVLFFVFDVESKPQFDLDLCLGMLSAPRSTLPLEGTAREGLRATTSLDASALGRSVWVGRSDLPFS